MTGEITLRGSVLPVGGIKEKVLAAHRAGIKRVLLPDRNRKDLVDIPETIRKDIELIFVSRMKEVLEMALEAVPVVVPGPGVALAARRPPRPDASGISGAAGPRRQRPDAASAGVSAIGRHLAYPCMLLISVTNWLVQLRLIGHTTQVG